MQYKHTENVKWLIIPKELVGEGIYKHFWPDCEVILAYELMMSVFLSVLPSVNILVNLCGEDKELALQSGHTVCSFLVFIANWLEAKTIIFR